MSEASALTNAGAASGIKAPLNYLESREPRPVNYAYDPPAGVPRRSGRIVQRSVVVANGRSARDLSLDTSGFVLVPHESTVKDFYDAEEVKRTYYPEVVDLVKAVTGAEKVLIFDHVVRNPLLAARGAKDIREPGRIVHNDYSFKSAPRRVRDHLPGEAETLLKNRFAEINVWRAIKGPLQDAPLALCDARSIAPEDAVPSDLIYPDRVGETLGFVFNPSHRWFYFPDMQPNEALLLKCYDSKDDGRARYTAHTAFDDPTKPPHAGHRESIEVRAIVFFSPERS
ncbi:MAG TPA: CmcJ/NvfI family oxidoreductase [Candidatus Binataceae bacterium]|nr:CmcJ/NvfI family oxidoreductase [Candidatus Binataceae bacterium]